MAFLVASAFAVAFTLVYLLIAVAIEQIAPIERYSLRQRRLGILLNIIGPVAGIAVMWPIGLWWQDHVPFLTIPLDTWLQPLGVVGYALQFLTILIVADFFAYWRHRAEHSRWLWPFHAVHHSPTELHAANNITHPVQSLFNWFFIGIPMGIIQIRGPEVPLVAGLVVGFLATYIHSPVDFHFGPLRNVIVDNRFHRIHHSLVPEHVGKNFGIWLSVWDRLFGTAYFPKPNEWPSVGVADLEPPRSVRHFLAMPFFMISGTRTLKPKTQLRTFSGDAN